MSLNLQLQKEALKKARKKRHLCNGFNFTLPDNDTNHNTSQKIMSF